MRQWLLLISMLGAAAIAPAHQVTLEECPQYTQIAASIMGARNHGISATDLVPAVMRAITACQQAADCPIKDAEDTKRVMNFVKQTYALEISGTQEIDIEASAANIEHQCEVKAGAVDKRMTPELGVPSTGKQVEG